MNDDQTCDGSWVALEAATRNIVLLLQLKGTAPAAAGELTAAGALNSGEDATEREANIETKCSAHSSTSKQLNAAGDVQLRQRG